MLESILFRLIATQEADSKCLPKINVTGFQLLGSGVELDKQLRGAQIESTIDNSTIVSVHNCIQT